MTFSHATTILVNIPFDNEDLIVIISLYHLKGSTAQKVLKKIFSSKIWNKQSLQRLSRLK